MKRSKNILFFATCLVFMFALTACGSKGNDLLKEASPSTSVLSLYYYDGETGFCSWISDNALENEILNELSTVDAKEAKNWSASEVTYPLYGIEIGSTDGMGVHLVWSNGYLIMRDGAVYRFDYDFSKLKDGYDWSDERELTSTLGMPCSRYLVQNGGNWNAGLLPEAGKLAPPDGITMLLGSWTEDEVTVTFCNDTEEEWGFSEYYSLQVLLDGTWYQIPVTPENNWGFNDIEWILPAGEERSMSYDLTMYGDLPAGNYRLVAEDMTVEGTVS